MSYLEIITKSANETQGIGYILAGELLKEKHKKAVIIGLEGELGSGKTTFVQGLARGLGLKEKITSPTFLILKKYKIKVSSSNFQVLRFFHIDCYRLTTFKDLIDLDLEEIVNQPQNIIVIEWAERVKKILPKDNLWMKFEHLGENRRKISIINR